MYFWSIQKILKLTSLIKPKFFRQTVMKLFRLPLQKCKKKQSFLPLQTFPFDLKPNGNLFGSKSKEKLSPRSYSIQFERKWKYSFLSVQPSERLLPLGIMCCPIKGLPETLQTLLQYCTECFKGNPQLGFPLKYRVACTFSSPGKMSKCWYPLVWL